MKQIIKKCFTFLVNPLRLLILIFLAFLQLEYDRCEECRVVTCENKISFQHVADISMIQTASVTESQCKAKLAQIHLQGVVTAYCPDEFFCGLDLLPENTGKKGLQFNQTATCLLISKSEDRCLELVANLKLYGWSETTFFYLFRHKLGTCLYTILNLERQF